jgi:hypothetical protein
LGLVDYLVQSWNALFAPAGTPLIIDRLAKLLAHGRRDTESGNR